MRGLIIDTKCSINEIEYIDPIQDDPKVRKPDISKAKSILKWSPTTQISEGIDKTFNYFKEILQ